MLPGYPGTALPAVSACGRRPASRAALYAETVELAVGVAVAAGVAVAVAVDVAVGVAVVVVAVAAGDDGLSGLAWTGAVLAGGTGGGVAYPVDADGAGVARGLAVLLPWPLLPPVTVTGSGPGTRSGWLRFA